MTSGPVANHPLPHPYHQLLFMRYFVCRGVGLSVLGWGGSLFVAHLLSYRYYETVDNPIFIGGFLVGMLLFFIIFFRNLLVLAVIKRQYNRHPEETLAKLQAFFPNAHQKYRILTPKRFNALVLFVIGLVILCGTLMIQLAAYST